MEEIKKLFSKNELRRLEKAAKEKDKFKLAEWAKQFEEQVEDIYRDKYEKEYRKSLEETVENFLIAIVYTLHFNEKCKFGNNRIVDFINDLMAVIDGFRTGEYSPEEYKKILEKQKVYFNTDEFSIDVKEKKVEEE